MKEEVVILQHDPKESAGTLLDYLRKKRIPFRAFHLYKNGALPELEKVRAVIAMGGPMNVYEEIRYPFLKKENLFIQRAVEARLPYLGICLGSQLLAKALGARVYKAKMPEIGWGEVWLTQDAHRSVFGNFAPGALKVLQWHGDTFDLPFGAVLLAKNAVVPHQAYSMGGRFYGFQFHVEVNRPILESWFKGRALYSDILADYERYERDLNRAAEYFYSNFFEGTDP